MYQNRHKGRYPPPPAVISQQTEPKAVAIVEPKVIIEPKVIVEPKVMIEPAKARDWQNPDVHAHTREMVMQLCQEFADLPRLTVTAIDEFEEVCAEILAKYPSEPVVVACLEKMRNRKLVVDRDLCGVMPAGLLAVVWNQVVKPTEAYDHFLGTLKDMGTTCVQGDTHRLFATYVAFTRPQ